MCSEGEADCEKNCQRNQKESRRDQKNLWKNVNITIIENDVHVLIFKTPPIFPTMPLSETYVINFWR